MESSSTSSTSSTKSSLPSVPSVPSVPIFTEEARYSTTTKEQARQIINAIDYSTHSQPIRIVDGTAGWGGDVVSFLKQPRKWITHVTAVEIHPDHVAYLTHRLNTWATHPAATDSYRPGEDVTVHSMDVLTFFQDTSLNQSFNAVYLDPPWGGPNYKDKEKEKKGISLFLSSVPLSSVLVDYITPTSAVWVFLKVPLNLDIRSLQQSVQSSWLLQRISSIYSPVSSTDPCLKKTSFYILSFRRACTVPHYPMYRPELLQKHPECRRCGTNKATHVYVPDIPVQGGEGGVSTIPSLKGWCCSCVPYDTHTSTTEPHPYVRVTMKTCAHIDRLYHIPCPIYVFSTSYRTYDYCVHHYDLYKFQGPCRYKRPSSSQDGKPTKVVCHHDALPGTSYCSLHDTEMDQKVESNTSP